ncbi:MAG: VapC toxin family PIN domain ribonuclease [Chloroflexaceae bacterium]|nr:VapC toxin family PIN domain ribonuclease [Chloroflexaceae bacterium]
MTTAGSHSTFLDISVLVHASMRESPLHRAALHAIQGLRNDMAELWTSRQVLREYLVLLTDPQVVGEQVHIPTIIHQVQAIQQRLHIAEDGPEVTRRLFALLKQVQIHGKEVYHANTVATMQVYGIRQIVTSKPIEFRLFASFIIVVPLMPNE